MQLEKCDNFGLLHDGTTHWANGINTIFVCVVTDDGAVYKIPYSMQKVAGSFTGEVLHEELISEISAIKLLKENAADKIVDAVKTYKKSEGGGIKSEFKRWHIQLKVMFPVYLPSKYTLCIVIFDT